MAAKQSSLQYRAKLSYFLPIHTATQKRIEPMLVPRFARKSKGLLRHHDGDLLLRGASTAVRTNNRDRMLPGLQRLGEMPELAIGRDVRHGLAVDDERGSRLGTADNFRHASVKLSALYFEHHVLGFALSHQSELKRLAYFAGFLLGV